MRKVFPVILVLLLIAEIIALAVFASQPPKLERDTVEVNEAVQSVTRDFDNLSSHENVTSLDYVVLDGEGNVAFKTRDGLSESVNAAVAHRDTALDISVDGAVVGKLIIYNDGAQALMAQKRTAVGVLAAATAIGCIVCLIYALYLYFTVIRPFRKLKDFALRVADGNLDIPLEMDRSNLFGAFTESFDIMRSELKAARIAEARAQQSKKELVAKLSHDIKTPVASIKAVSEVGLAISPDERVRDNYTQIIAKADQINTLVTNLFSATLEELQQLAVTVADIGSDTLAALIANADYLHRAKLPDIPDCLVCADRLRLQQVFDNIFANSYKYADTDIVVEASKDDYGLIIAVEDFGGGVDPEELPTLKEKYKRGSNSSSCEGAGLGLYISDYFMREMGGSLEVLNGEHGLKIIVTLRLSGKI